MHKKITLLFLLICTSFMTAGQQTTLDNYRYISTGHDLAINNGLALHPDYTFTFLRYDTCEISTDRRIISAIYKVEYTISGTIHTIGYKVVMKDSISNYSITVCKPQHTSHKDIIQLYLDQINGFIPEFNKAWNQIIIKLP